MHPIDVTASLGRLAVVVLETHSQTVATGLLTRQGRRLKPELQRFRRTPGRPGLADTPRVHFCSYGFIRAATGR